MTRVVAVGECMVELTHTGDDALRMSFAGDSFNTAVYLARTTGAGEVAIGYVTAVGDDWYSDRLLRAAAAEGIDTRLVRRVAGRTPGLYLVRTDAAGERSFTYHRGESPAREMFGPGWPAEIDADIVRSDLVYLSLVTLQILSADARERIWDVLGQARRGGAQVVFDGNYRAAGWPGAAAARAVVSRTLALSDVYLPTLDDERALFGDHDGDACAARLVATGVREAVVKDGARGCLVVSGGAVTRVPALPGVTVVDTTAAGDSFNAGYLSARLRGERPARAAVDGHRLAAQVVGHPGALLPSVVLPQRDRLCMPS